MKKEDELTTSAQAFDHHLKAVPTDSLLLSGRRFKEYKTTQDTFTKLKMWPERYEAELAGISLARSVGVSVPEVIDHNIDVQWGSVSYRFIEAKRLDQVVWSSGPSPELIFDAGSTLAQIHQAKPATEPIADVFVRRHTYFLDDMRQRSSIPEDCYTLANQTFKKIETIIKDQGERGCAHGDYVLQNVFDTKPMTVFDWEYSHSGFCPFDAGSFLSNMLFAATEGNWNFTDYHENYSNFLKGYELTGHNLGVEKELIAGLRFLGHRVPPQFYLFVMEKLAILDSKKEVEEILNGGVTPIEAKLVLKQHGVEMDENWGEKVLVKLQSGGYKPDVNFWNWVGANI